MMPIHGIDLGNNFGNNIGEEKRIARE